MLCCYHAEEVWKAEQRSDTYGFDVDAEWKGDLSIFHDIKKELKRKEQEALVLLTTPLSEGEDYQNRNQSQACQLQC